MAGRTAGKYTKFQIESSSGAMCDIPVTSYGDVGLNYAEQDVSCLQDALTSVLNGQGSFSTTITGPFDTSTIVAGSATAVAPALSGSHTVLKAIDGSNVARSFGVYVGIQHYWTTSTDPVFGGIDCVLVSGYTVDPAAGTYSAKLTLAGNRTNDPTWGTSSITASS
jgi:hypothetical protein